MFPTFKFMNELSTKQKALRLFILQITIAIFLIVPSILVFNSLQSNTVAKNTNEVTKSVPSLSILDGLSDINNSTNNSTSSSETNSTNLPEVSDNKKKYISGVESTDKQNSIEISKISVEGNVIEGPTSNQDSLLLQGFWLYPETGYPEINTNIPVTPVIFGHRLYKRPPETETFYNLDKLVAGDLIVVNYNNLVYYYEVESIRIIEKNDWAAIEAEPYDALKLVTCTPIDSFVNAPQRILVKAKMLK
jgi:LPXTG-site transpeptidase (sortase) family protein